VSPRRKEIIALIEDKFATLLVQGQALEVLRFISLLGMDKQASTNTRLWSL
jgi:hypothetical protein